MTQKELIDILVENHFVKQTAVNNLMVYKRENISCIIKDGPDDNQTLVDFGTYDHDRDRHYRTNACDYLYLNKPMFIELLGTATKFFERFTIYTIDEDNSEYS